MSPLPANVKNPRLYARVKAEAKARFRRYPSAYASAWIVKEYRARGGEYRGPRTADGVARWMAEKWVQVLPYLEGRKRVACGAPHRRTKACRPLKRVSPRTPPTLPELLALHGRDALRRLARAKNRDMSLRVDWARARVRRPKAQKKSRKPGPKRAPKRGRGGRKGRRGGARPRLSAPAGGR